MSKCRDRQADRLESVLITHSSSTSYHRIMVSGSRMHSRGPAAMAAINVRSQMHLMPWNIPQPSSPSGRFVNKVWRAWPSSCLELKRVSAGSHPIVSHCSSWRPPSRPSKRTTRIFHPYQSTTLAVTDRPCLRLAMPDAAGRGAVLLPFFFFPLVPPLHPPCSIN